MIRPRTQLATFYELTVYYRGGKPVKSILTTSYYPHSPANTYTYHFHKEPILKRIWNKITGHREDYDEIKTIDLRDIYNGLNGS